MDLITQPWHWAFSGFMISVIMFLLIFTGRKFGVSTSFETVCNIAGAGKFSDYFKYDWKSQTWLLLFVLGSIIGGWLSSTVLQHSGPVEIAASTISDLGQLGIEAPTANSHTESLLPHSVYSFESLGTVQGFILMVLGGFLIGFGTRWAGGCTSGHAITGLSNLQIPSLVAVVGFFIGGLVMTHLLFPIIFGL